MEKIDNLNSFLSLGYFMDYKNPSINFDFKDIPELKKELSKLTKEELFKECKKRWFETFQRLYEKGEHLVPISGGFDSRAVLATLLEFTEANKISTYTFGTPGTYDYELGKLLGKKVGTKHSQFSFYDYEFSTEKEIEVSKRTDHQTFLFHHAPLEKIDVLYKDFFVWSGFMFDWIAGSHMPIIKSNDIQIAVKNNFNRDKFVRSIVMPGEDAIEYDVKISLDSQYLSLEEQIEGLNRYPKYIAPNILYGNQNFKLPGYEEDLFLFFFSLNDCYRKGEKFYIDFLVKEFPELFSLPLKSMNGLTLNSLKSQKIFTKIKNRVLSQGKRLFPSIVHPHTNYMDFNEGIRNRKDLNKVVYDNINDLKSRKLIEGISIDQLYNNHMSRKGNHADALIVLASLEIHLKAGKKL